MTASAAKASKSTLAGTVKSPKAAAKSRKASERQAITKTLRTIERIQKSLTRARTAIGESAMELTGPVFDQMSQVAGQLDVAVSVTQAEIETQATALARTFIGK